MIRYSPFDLHDDVEDSTQKKSPRSRERSLRATRIFMFSDSRVFIETDSKVKFGRVIFKRRLIKRCKGMQNGVILKFLKNRSGPRHRSRFI